MGKVREYEIASTHGDDGILDSYSPTQTIDQYDRLTLICRSLFTYIKTNTKLKFDWQIKTESRAMMSRASRHLLAWRE